MAAQKHIKKIRQKFFGIFECLLLQNHLIKALFSLDSSKSYGRLLQNPKTLASRDLFLHESDFKASSTVNFPKKHPDFRGLETNQRHETQTRIFFICPSTYDFNII